jgi:hypothetical protein
MGTKKRAEDYVKVSGEGVTPDLRARSTSGPRYLPGPTRHSTAMLHSQVAGEGHNNKEFAP